MNNEKTADVTASDLNAIVRLRRCYHEGAVKKKITAVAFDAENKHYQFFDNRECCAGCGVIMQPNGAMAVRLLCRC